MKTDDAKRMLEACRKKTAEIGKPVSVAIVDAGGLMVLFERLNEPPPFTAAIAEAKASASAFMGRDSGALAPMAQGAPGILSAVSARLNGRFAPHQGAVVLRDGSGVVGAIGVSGATSEEDEAIARAGAEALAG